MSRRRDTRTGDLFELRPDWQPAPASVSFSEPEIRAATIAGRVSRAVARALADCADERPAVAKRMGEYLGEPVSLNTLNAYASQARDEHRINVPRFAGLVHATGDMRLLSVVPELFGHAVVPARYLSWIEVGQLAETRDEINRAFELARRQARRGGP